MICWIFKVSNCQCKGIFIGRVVVINAVVVVNTVVVGNAVGVGGGDVVLDVGVYVLLLVKS